GTGADAEAGVLNFRNGLPVNGTIQYYSAPVDTLYADESYSERFNGRIEIGEEQVAAYSEDGTQLLALYGGVVQNGAPLTSAAFEKGLAPLFPGGGYIVTFAVLLFAISTSISWSYYGDRAAQYLLGFDSIFWYRLAFVGMHFFGAVVTITTIWNFGDVMLGLMAFFNIVSLFALSGVAYKITKKYFENPDV
ncbi:MAG: alanine:cation symporter family protein, partial [Balneolaceae bacterium]|nr:alanine:cation symporter family protein [Balneolaceae bacterium]